jgi:uncharacterized membrane protein YeaQ/YmgE (transglycosylase-associated protein family)
LEDDCPAKSCKAAGSDSPGDLIIGTVGAFIGSWLFPERGTHLCSGIVATIIHATIGALILWSIITLGRDGGGWRGHWGRRW